VASFSDTDPENPTVTFDADASAGGTNLVGAWIIEYGSRRSTVNADATIAISEMHSMEGVLSAFTSSSFVTAHLGLLKASYRGLRPQHLINDAAPGTPRQWTDRYAGFILRASMRECGRAPTHLVCTMAQMDEVTKEYTNLRRFEPVQGKQGADYTTMAIVAHGKVLKYHPDVYAVPRAMIQTDPSFSEYLENLPLGPAVPSFERRFVPRTDQDETILARRGNILFSNPQGLGLTDDLIESEFAIN
jgi:hypothetical protein